MTDVRRHVYKALLRAARVDRFGEDWYGLHPRDVEPSGLEQNEFVKVLIQLSNSGLYRLCKTGKSTKEWANVLIVTNDAIEIQVEAEHRYLLNKLHDTPDEDRWAETRNPLIALEWIAILEKRGL